MAALSIPAAGKGPGVLVLHDWMGVLPHVPRLCERLAEAGFVATAVDLYDGRSTTDPRLAGEWLDALDDGEAQVTLVRAAAELRGHPAVHADRMASIGFSMGARVSLLAAGSIALDAVVAYYGLPGPADRRPVPCPVLMHLAEIDDWDPPDAPETLVEFLRAGGTEVDARAYPGVEHGFANEDVPAFDPTAAAEAWAATIGFLDRVLMADGASG